MLYQIRYQQQSQQLRDRLVVGTGTIVSYQTRDATTGHRIVVSADGGRQSAWYLSNSQPIGTIAIAQPSSIGLTGYISQKPH